MRKVYPAANRLPPGVLDGLVTPSNQIHPSSTTFLRAFPDSTNSCARRKLAALMAPKVSVSVVRIKPESTSWTTSLSRRYDRWRFWRDGEEQAVRVDGGNIANDGDVVRLWALTGRGVIYKSGLDAAAVLAAGRLVALCTEWQTEASPIYMVLPGRRQLTPGLRLLREFISERCAALSKGE